MVSRELLIAAVAQFWQVAALAGIVAIVSRLVARNRPHLAHALWLVVLVKCLTPPVWSSPAGVFCWLQAARIETDRSTSPAISRPPVDIAASTQVDTRAGVVYADLAATEAEPVDVSVRAYAASNADETPRAPVAGEVALAESSPSVASYMIGVAAAVWLAGAALIFAVAAIRGLRCWRLVHRNHLAADPRLARRLRVLCRRIGLRRDVRLLISDSRVGPAVVGLLRPTIMLPTAVVRGRCAEELDPILAHELLHVRRGDLWVGLLQAVAQAVWWFHPLVWLAGRMISREAERCCDEEVIAALVCPPSRYAKCLLDVLELKRTLVAVPVFPGVRPVEVTSQRLERIMTLGQGCRRRTPWWCWAVMLLAAAVMLPGAALVVGADEPTADELVNAADSSAGANPAGGSASHGYSDPLSKFARSAQRLSDSGLFTRATEDKSEIEFELGEELAIIVKELGVTRDAARQFLLDRLLSVASCGSPGDDEKPVARWSGDTLVLHLSPDDRQRVENEIALSRRHGFKQVEVQVRFAWGPPEDIEKVADRWTILPTQVAREESLPAGPGRAFPVLVDLGEPPANKASFTVEKKLPVLVELMDEDRQAQVLDRLQARRRINITQAPKVTLTNGRSGVVMDCNYSPFVVGLSGGQPQIRVVSAGRTLRLRPIIGDAGLRLDYELTQATIRSVETITIPAHDDRKPVTLQVPEVAKCRIESSIELPPDKSLLVGVLSTVNKKGEKKSVLMLLTAKEVPAATARSNADVKEQQTLVGVGVNSNAGLVGKVDISDASPTPAGDRRPIVGAISIVGNKNLSSSELQACLATRVGERLDPAKMQQDVATLTEKYATAGYVMASVNAAISGREGSKQLDVVYHVDEGAHYRVGEINVKVTNVTAPSADGRPVAREGINNRDATLQAAKVLARVGDEVIRSIDVLPGVNESMAANEDRIAPREAESVRVKLIQQRLRPLIETKLLVIDAHRNMPPEDFRKIMDRLGEQFEEAEIKKHKQRRGVDTRAELDTKLRASGTSLDVVKQAWIERQLAAGWLFQQVKTKTKEGTHDEQPAEETRAELKEFLARLRHEIPVWTAFDDTQGEDATHGKDPNADKRSTGNAPPLRPPYLYDSRQRISRPRSSAFSDR